MKKLVLFASFVFVVALIFTFSSPAFADIFQGATGSEDKCEHEYCRTDDTTGEEKCLWNGIPNEFCSCCKTTAQ